MILTHQTINESYALEDQPLQGRASEVSDDLVVGCFGTSPYAVRRHMP